MISFPPEIAGILNLLDSRGHAAWAVGGCVRDSLLGARPKDWDLAVSPELPALLELFPGAKVQSRAYSVLRLEFKGPSAGTGLTADLAAFRTDGPYTDRRRPDFVSFGVPIEADLARRDFTVNAICAHPGKGFLDPYEGRADLGARRIRMVGDPVARLDENPIRMLRALRLAAELGFDLDDALRRAILRLGDLLPAAGADRIRAEFQRLLAAPDGGRGLALMMECNVLGAVAGCPAASLGDAALERLSVLCSGIGAAPPEAELRLGLFYRCLEPEQGRAALDLLAYDRETRRRLEDALELGDRLDALEALQAYLDFLARFGPSRTRWLGRLMESWALLFDGTQDRAARRSAWDGEIAASGRPVRIAELAVDGTELIRAGVPEGEPLGRILSALLALVHREPQANTITRLLNEAKTMAEAIALTEAKTVAGARRPAGTGRNDD